LEQSIREIAPNCTACPPWLTDVTEKLGKAMLVRGHCTGAMQTAKPLSKELNNKQNTTQPR